MGKTTPALVTPLREPLERLAAFEPDDLPVLSLYLNLAADQHGRDSYDAFLRKTLAERRKAFRDHTPQRESFDRDAKRLRAYVGGVDRIVEGPKTRRNAMGGWSQARYQRRADNIHLHNVREAVEALDRIVSADNIPHIVIAGDAVVAPLVKEQLPQRLIDRLVDVVHLEPHLPEDQLLGAMLEVLHEKDGETDAAYVATLIGGWLANGLAVVGPAATLEALTRGQVDQLLIAGTPDRVAPVQELPSDVPVGGVTVSTTSLAGAGDPRSLQLAGELVARAERTGARIRFIEDPGLLQDVGGVGAWLRFRW